jgi:anti-sigma B factor antagonist
VVSERANYTEGRVSIGYNPHPSQGRRQFPYDPRRASMQLDQRIVGDVAIVTVTGDITLNQGANVVLKDKVQSLLLQGYKNLLFDLGGVSNMDSAGLGELVHAYVSTKNRGGSLRLLHVTKRLHNLLVVTKLLTVFDTYDSEADALASFGASAAS